MRKKPVDHLTASERTKYEKMWGFEQYRDNKTNVQLAKQFIELLGAPLSSASIMDIGCGPGYASSYFHSMGMRVIAVDIASNALEQKNRGVFDFYCGAVWNLPEHLSADYGFCTDFMEHVPTERVEATLSAIRACVHNKVYFQISLREDGCGKLINDVLHLTVRPYDWWLRMLHKYWDNVDVLDHDSNNKSAIFIAHCA